LVDVLILSCTHYLILKNLIVKNIDQKIKIIESGIPVAKKLRSILKANNLFADEKNLKTQFFCTGNSNKFYQNIKNLLANQKINKNQIKKISL